MNVQQEYNQRIARLNRLGRREPRKLQPTDTPQRPPEAEVLLKMNRAMQFRTRLSTIERKLFSLKSYLRDQPQDAAVRAEAGQLEAMYVQLLSGNAA